MNINNKNTWFEEELKKLENDNDVMAYKYILDFSETVLDILDKKGIKNKNKFLANQLGTSPAYISKLFNGKTNFTVKKLLEIANAVNYKLELNLRPKLVAVSQTANSTISINAFGKIENVSKDNLNEPVDVTAQKTYAFTTGGDNPSKAA